MTGEQLDLFVEAQGDDEAGGEHWTEDTALRFCWGWTHAGGRPARLSVRVGQGLPPHNVEELFTGVPPERPHLAPFDVDGPEDDDAWSDWVTADFAGAAKDRTTAIPRIIVEALFPVDPGPKVRKAQIAAVAKLTRRKDTYSVEHSAVVDAVLAATRRMP